MRLQKENIRSSNRAVKTKQKNTFYALSNENNNFLTLQNSIRFYYPDGDDSVLLDGSLIDPKMVSGGKHGTYTLRVLDCFTRSSKSKPRSTWLTQGVQLLNS